MNGRCDGCRVRTGSRNISRDRSNITCPILAATKEIPVQGIVVQICPCNDFHFFKLATVISSCKGHNRIITSVNNIILPTTFKRGWFRFHTIDGQLSRHFRTCGICYSNHVTGIGINCMVTIQNTRLSCYSTRLQGSIRCYDRLSRSIRYCCSDFIIIIIQDNGRSRLSTGHCYRRLGVGFLQQACLNRWCCKSLHWSRHIICSVIFIGNGHHTRWWNGIRFKVLWSGNIWVSSLKSLPNLIFFSLSETTCVINKSTRCHRRNRITNTIILRQNLNTKRACHWLLSRISHYKRNIINFPRRYDLCLPNSPHNIKGHCTIFQCRGLRHVDAIHTIATRSVANALNIISCRIGFHNIISLINVIRVINRNHGIIGWSEIVLGRTETGISIYTISVTRIPLARCRTKHRIDQAIASTLSLAFHGIDLNCRIGQASTNCF